MNESERFFGGGGNDETKFDCRTDFPNACDSGGQHDITTVESNNTDIKVETVEDKITESDQIEAKIQNDIVEEIKREAMDEEKEKSKTEDNSKSEEKARINKKIVSKKMVRLVYDKFVNEMI